LVVGLAKGAYLDEDGLLGGLREKGLITCPSSTLLAFLEEYPDLFKDEVLLWLDPPARASLARTGRVMRDTVYPLAIFPSGPPRGLHLGPVRLFKVGPMILPAT
jgi:hypothetical protein